MADKKKWEPKPVLVTLEIEEPREENGDWKILAAAIVAQGYRTLQGKSVQFFLNSLPVGAESQTDQNGRVVIDISLSADIKTNAIEAQMVGRANRARKIVSLPQKKEDKKPVPAELIVDPTRIVNKINLFVRVVDEKYQGVPNSKITIVDGKNILTKNTDKDGEYMHPVKLTKKGKEREIAIYVAGYGDRGYRQTFRGR
ncbi:MAG: hypothetical protein ABIJ84_04120 [bacterium]